MAKTAILYREDLNNPLHPNLWEDVLEALGVDPEAEEIDVQLSAFDTNKLVKED
jgi:hypothetical protein